MDGSQSKFGLLMKNCDWVGSVCLIVIENNIFAFATFYCVRNMAMYLFSRLDFC